MAVVNLGIQSQKALSPWSQKVVRREMGIKHHFLVFNLPAVKSVYYNY